MNTLSRRLALAVLLAVAAVPAADAMPAQSCSTTATRGTSMPATFTRIC